MNRVYLCLLLYTKKKIRSGCTYFVERLAKLLVIIRENFKRLAQVIKPKGLIRAL